MVSTFLSEMTIDEHGNKRPIHERLLKAEISLLKLIKENTIFTYLIVSVKVEDNIYCHLSLQ